MVGSRLNDRYTITAELGAGAMGQVYLARDEQTGAQVAIKVLPPALAKDKKYLSRFEREIQALHELNHPNIVPYIDSFQEGTKQYLVMAYMPGGSLHDRLENEGALSIDEARQIAMDLTDALIRAHRLGIVHRDIKPENILFDADGTPHLSDFGVAGIEIAEGTRLTGTGGQIGTPYYMSPEAWQGEPQDAQSDIWSLGVVIYEMLAGSPPFVGKSAVALMREILQTPAPDLLSLRRDVPTGLYQIIRKALAKDRAQRYQYMRDLGADLERGKPAIPLKGTGMSAPKQARHFSGAWVLGIVLSLLTIIIVGLIFTMSREEEISLSQADLDLTQTIIASASFVPSYTPTATPSPSMTLTATSATPVAQPLRELAARLGPGSDYPVVMSFAVGDELEISGISEDGTWYQVVLPDGSKGWITSSTDLVKAFGNLSAVQVAFAPTNTATLTPTKTLTFAPTNTATFMPTPTDMPTPTNTLTFTPEAPTPTKIPVEVSAATLANSENPPLNAMQVELCNDGLCIVPLGGTAQPFLVVPKSELDWGDQMVWYTWSPDGSQIVFSVRIGAADKNSLFNVNSDGSNLTEIRKLCNPLEPSWSPNGDWLVVHDCGDLAVMHPDGSSLVNFQTEGTVEYPQWSPDSEWIVFSHTNGLVAPTRAYPHTRGVWVVHLDAKNEPPTLESALNVVTTTHTTASCDDAHVAFSPDGHQVVFVDGECRTMLINADGSGEPVEIPSFPLWWTSNVYPQWEDKNSPSEPQAAAAGTIATFCEGKEHVTLCLTDEGGAAIAEYDTGLQGTVLGNATWSPDGKKVTFSVCSGVDCSPLFDGQLYIANVDGTSLTALPRSSNDNDANWSPDGKWVAFHSGCDLRSIRPDGTDVRLLVDSMNGIRCVYRIRWSPDSQWLAIVTAHTNEPSDSSTIWALRPDGSELQVVHSSGPDIKQNFDMAWTPDGKQLVVDYNGSLIAIDTACLETQDCDEDDYSPFPGSIHYSWLPTYYPQWGRTLE